MQVFRSHCSQRFLCLVMPLLQDVLRFVCKLLMHPFPRVRRIAAENFYVKLLEQPWMQDDHPAISLLLGNAWDGDLSDADISRMAADVAVALGVPEKEHVVNADRQ